MVEVAALEGLAVDRAAMEQLVESCGADIRQILNTLQMWAVKDRRVGSADMAARLESLAKDGNLRLDAFTAAPKMFLEARTLELNARMEYFFGACSPPASAASAALPASAAPCNTSPCVLVARVTSLAVDYDMIPLLIQQSYVSTADKAGGPEAAKLARISKAADCIADSDIFEGYVRKRQAWGLLPAVAASYTRAATWTAGPSTLIPFPTWLGRNSARGKRSRLLAEMGVRMASHVSGGRESVRLDYLDALRYACYRPLEGPPADLPAAFEAVMAVLDAYSLSRVSAGGGGAGGGPRLLLLCTAAAAASQEDMMETMAEVVFKDLAPPCLDVDSKVKGAFTRAYKKAVHRSQALAALESGAFKPTRARARKVIMTEDGEEEDDIEGGDDEEDDDGGGSDADDKPPPPPAKGA